MQVLAGTSGYAYKEWKGSFYPEDLPNAGMLAYYAGRLPTVEINNTFYRLPSKDVLLQWAEQVPQDFAFVLKASRRITHLKRLKNAAEPLPDGLMSAFEFRHASWFEDDVYGALRERHSALVVADTDDGTTPLQTTAPFGYLRLRREQYDDGALERWRDEVCSQSWERAFMFFKHEDAGAGPALAERFLRAVRR
jgi:uncharacterized protein YecE (DUF72 family)